MLINMIAPVIVNVLQLALSGEAIPQFPTEPTIIPNKENNNIEENKQQESTNKVKDRSHTEQKTVNRGSGRNIKINNGSNHSDKINNRFNLLNNNDKNSEEKKDQSKFVKTPDQYQDESDKEAIKTIAESVTKKDFEIKKELYDIEVITTQALEAIVKKLIFDLAKEQEEWKSIIKEIRVINKVKIEQITKKIAEQTKSNEELVKTNGNLSDHMQKMKRDHEFCKNQCRMVVQKIEKLDRE